MHPVQQLLSVFRWPVPHAVPRYHAATKAERRKARTVADDRLDELRAFHASLDDDQRRAAIQRGAMRG